MAVTYTRTITANLGTAKAGLVGTLGYTVKDSADATLVARTTSGITELGTGTGIYRANVAGWDAAWGGRVEWDTSAGTALAVGSFTPYAAQTGDSFGRIGPNGAGLTALATATGQTSILTDLATKASQASVDTIDDYVDAEVAAIKLVTDHLATALELDGSAYRFTAAALEQGPAGSGGSGVLAADGLDAIEVEPGVNLRQAMSPILAAAAGVLSGAGTGTIVVKGGGNPTITRITTTSDASGNRLSVTLNLPA